MVHRQLEFMKYVGGIRGKKSDGTPIPSGQGLEIGIVMLPDLLLDVRRYNFNTKEPVFAVGGRAARMACALLHLLGEDDGTFQVYVLTKTGNLGRLLLENEFRIGESRRSFSNPFLEYVQLRGGQPRCAIRNTLGAAVDSSVATKRGELSESDLDEPRVRQLIQKARAICLTSLKTPHFHKLFDTLLSHAPIHGLFVDSRMSKDPYLAMRSLVQHLRKTQKQNRQYLDKIAAVFLRYDQQDAFCKAAHKSSLDQVCTELQISLVTYGDGHVRLWMPNGLAPAITITSELDVKREGVSECFKAGVLLAWSVWQTVCSLEQSHPELHQRLAHEWTSGAKRDGCWTVVLQYAVDLAMTRYRTGLAACTLEDVITYLRKSEGAQSGTNHLPDPAVGFDPQRLPLQIEPAGKPRRRLVINNDAAPSVLAELAGR